MSVLIPIPISPEVDYNWWCSESCCNSHRHCAILTQHVACYLSMCVHVFVWYGCAWEHCKSNILRESCLNYTCRWTQLPQTNKHTFICNCCCFSIIAKCLLVAASSVSFLSEFATHWVRMFKKNSHKEHLDDVTFMAQYHKEWMKFFSGCTVSVQASTAFRPGRNKKWGGWIVDFFCQEKKKAWRNMKHWERDMTKVRDWL